MGKLDPLNHQQHEGEDGTVPEFHSNSPTPEAIASRSEVSGLLEEAIMALPYTYRTVIVLRDVEEMSAAKTAEVLSLTEADVKVRLHRAHEQLLSEVRYWYGQSDANHRGQHGGCKRRMRILGRVLRHSSRRCGPNVRPSACNSVEMAR